MSPRIITDFTTLSFCIIFMLGINPLMGLVPRRDRISRIRPESAANIMIAADDHKPLVNFELYYEALCPDCQQFITTQLYPTAQKVGKIMNLTLVPYGNAKEAKDGDHWNFTCQHGPKECVANLIETCALSLYQENTTSWTQGFNNFLDFLFCMESSDDPSTAGQNCSKQTGLDWSRIKACTGGKQGNALQHKMALLTESLNPPHTWVPWVVLNGVHSDEIQEVAETDLLKLICDTYTGTRPKNCPT